jgi:hypothetical protein
VAIFLLNETNMQLPIDTDALPLVGIVPHSIPLIPHRWPGFGSQQPHHHGQAHEQERTGSWARNPRTCDAPVIQLSVATPPSGEIFCWACTPPAMSAVNLNEVFA